MKPWARVCVLSALAVGLSCDEAPDEVGDGGAVAASVSALGELPPECSPGMTRIEGTPGDDVLVGTGGDDCIVGYGGDDDIDGRQGDDVILGGDGHDTIRGGNGSDVIQGGGRRRPDLRRAG